LFAVVLLIEVNLTGGICVDVGDIESLQSDRFSVIVVKPRSGSEDDDCATQLDDRSLWSSDNAGDLSQYIEQRYGLWHLA